MRHKETLLGSVGLKERVQYLLLECRLIRKVVLPILKKHPLFCPHFFRPSCLQERYTYYRRKGGKLKSRTLAFVQFTCEFCESKTGFMNPQEHRQFNLMHCPTWGYPGSDSQGYRRTEPMEMDEDWG